MSRVRTSSGRALVAAPARFLESVRSPRFQDDPYAFYDEMRERAPVVRLETGGWLVTRYSDVSRIVRDPTLSADPRSSGLHRRYAGDRDDGTLGERAFSHMQFLDPPDHGRVRGEFGGPFAPSEVGGLGGVVRRHVDRLLDGLVRHDPQEPVDLITELADPLPLAVALDVLGLPGSDAPEVAGWARSLIANDDPDVLVDAASRRAAAAAATTFGRYLSRHAVAADRAGAGAAHGLLRAVVGAHRDGRLGLTEAVANLMFVVVASLETTAGLVGNGTVALFGRPDLVQRMVTDPHAAGPLVEELLRFDSPIQYTPRFTVHDLTIDDVTVPAGEHLMAVLGAANRDPAAFPDAGRLDPDRTGRRHLAFGGGAHYCMGSALARLEGATVLPALFARFPALRPAGPPQRRPMFTLRSLAHLPVRLGRPAG